MALKEKYYVQVWEQRGGVKPYLVPLKEINDLIESENAIIGNWEDIGEFTNIYDALKSLIEVTRPKAELAYDGEVKRSVIDSVSRNAIGQSIIYEDLKYKHIIEPYVNDPDAERGYVDIIDRTPAPFSIARITIRKPTDTTTPDQWSMAVDADAEEFAFNVPESGRAYSIDCVAGTTLSELIDLLEADAGFVSMFFINIKEGFDGTEIVGTREATNFTGGAGGHVMLATGEEIDYAAARAPSVQDNDSNPLQAAKANGTLTATGNPAALSTITIGTTTYTIVTALTTDPSTVPYEVLRGASASDTLDNLIAAINGAAGAGTNYSTGTVAHTLVDAAAGDGDRVTITAKAYGSAGNSIATTDTEPESGTDIAFGGATLDKGEDSRECVAGQILYRSEGLVVCVEDTTTTEENTNKYMFFAKDAG